MKENFDDQREQLERKYEILETKYEERTDELDDIKRKLILKSFFSELRRVQSILMVKAWCKWTRLTM